MSARTILCVFGTRPEAIKMVPVVRALRAMPGLRPWVCVTDQHVEMLDQVLTFFGVRPDERLGVMQAGQSPTQVAARVLDRLPAVLRTVGPAAVLVQGDTTTTVASALAAFYAGVPVGHVEAGLRTWRMDAPFPEEANRQLTSRLARWHFAPTPWARDNLLREGIAPERVALTGNTVIDALEWAAELLPGAEAAVVPRIDPSHRLVLVTAHRRENFGTPLAELCGALRDLACRNPDVEVVYPVHLNPNVQGVVRAALDGVARVHLLTPVDYPQLVALLRRCALVITDSGGIQEEAPTFGKPVLVLRETTERPEGIEAGTARLVGTARGDICAAAEELLRDPVAYARMATAHNPYGDGHAADRIAAILRDADLG